VILAFTVRGFAAADASEKKKLITCTMTLACSCPQSHQKPFSFVNDPMLQSAALANSTSKTEQSDIKDHETSLVPT